MNRWPLLRDIFLTGLGGVVIASQLVAFFLGKVPSDVLCALGLALTAPSVAGHIRTVLGSTGGHGPRSPSSPASGAPHSPSSPQAGIGDANGNS
jgi:hypothetical protein